MRPFGVSATISEPSTRPPSTLAVVVAAFAALSPILLAVVSPQAHPDPLPFVAAGLLTVAILAAALLIGRVPSLRWASAVPPLAYFVVVALLRSATTGADSPLGWAAALPVIWLALYGREREFLASLAGVAAVYLVPLAVGAAGFPPDAWPRGILSVLVVVALGWTVRHHARAAAEREALTRAIVASAQEAFVSWNDAGEITGWNRQAELLFGYSEREALGRPLIETIVPPRLREVAWRDLERFRAGQQPRLLGPRQELTARRRDGSEIAIEMTTSIVPTARGYLFNAFMHDISERTAAEQQLREHVRVLETIAQATHALSRSNDPAVARIAICEAARVVADAPMAFLVEPNTVDGFVVTASSGFDVPDDEIRVPELSGTAQAYISAKALFVADAHAGDDVGIGSVLFHPVDHAGETIGVLGIAWSDELAESPATVTAAMGLLAMHAAAAIERSNLLLRLGALARTDALTGLPNRRDWDETLPRELERAARDRRPVSIAMLDMDHFSAYNAAHGHPGGDRLLKASGAAWRSMLRAGDTLARCGGEEFGIILPGATLVEAVATVQRVRAATPGGETCSAGIAVWNGEESAAQLVARADAALYAAKQAGRDRTFTAPDAPRTARRGAAAR